LHYLFSAKAEERAFGSHVVRDYATYTGLPSSSEKLLSRDDMSVIVIDVCRDWRIRLQNILMALGVEVFYGFNNVQKKTASLLIFDKHGYEVFITQKRYRLCKKAFPHPPLCIVTGFSDHSEVNHTTVMSPCDSIHEMLSASGVLFSIMLEV
jgi:hypothetical protein